MKTDDSSATCIAKPPLVRSRWSLAESAAVIWGLVLSIAVCRTLLLAEHGQFFENHDGDGYGLRLIEFRDSLWNGALFPQWCFHFRGGLGAPFFNYYQPGFFYVASLAPASLPVAQQIGWATLAFSMAGYWGMLSLLSRRCSIAAGTLAGTFLLTAPYIHTELYIRGDFSEYAAMMLVPGVLAAMLQFCERPSRWTGFFGAMLLALVVLTHPAIGLVLSGLVTVVLIAVSLWDRDWIWARRGFTLLALGVGLSAVYWLPVFLESKYSSVEKMWDGKIFDGYYQYSRHFVKLSWLFDRAVTPTPIPVKLGLAHTLISALGLLLIVIRWSSLSATQRRAAGLCLFLLLASLFLMSPQSAGFWRALPLLGRIQFPWRLLSLVSIAMAGLSGMSISSIGNRGLRGIGLSLLCGWLLWPAMIQPRPRATRNQEPRFASEIANQFFAPDLADEWLPRDAKSLRINLQQRRVIANPPAEISDYQLRQGVLECTLNTQQSSSLLLPHYYFPVGFSATLNGQSHPLRRAANGLMRVEVPAGFSGQLRVEWHTTRAKQLGIAISLLTAIVGAGLLVRHRHHHDVGAH